MTEALVKPEKTMCSRCDGDGYVWAVGNCPDCYGDGWVAVPTQPAQLLEDLPHENRHISWCLTNSGENLNCMEEDAQLVLAAYEDGREIPSVSICLTPEDAAALGAWLIEAADHVLARYPEMRE